MARAKFEYNPQVDNSAEDTQDKNLCEVYGCNRIATIKTEHNNCRYHHGVSGERLGHVSLVLKNHASEINWWEVVMNMAFHEYDRMKGNAPFGMEPWNNEELIHYRARMHKYITELLK